MKLVFSSIKNGTIFDSDFNSLNSEQGTVEFKHLNSPGGIAVVYAPNGTGKSSFVKVLESEVSSNQISFMAIDETGKEITPETKVFHVILDQINRNVIKGKETDYLIGKQIRKEYELRERINSTFQDAFNSLSRTYKNDYKVSKVGDFLLKKIEEINSELYQKSYKYIRNIINTQSHGKYINQDEFVDYIRNSKKPGLTDLDESKRTWIINDVNKEKMTDKIINLDLHSIIADEGVVQLERNDDAIGILKKYCDLDLCIVCDNHDYNGNELLLSKTDTRKRIYENLDTKTKNLFDDVISNNSLSISDPFEIKRIVGSFIVDGNATEMIALQTELLKYIKSIIDEMVVDILECFDNTQLFLDYDAYSRLVATQPEFDSEEIIFIESVISDNIGKDITITRDSESKNYILKLGDTNLLNVDCRTFELSTGEQNFISLAFELLMARNSEKEYVVMDDPITSFDSFYMNKIAFCIVKFLERKKQIILTHNTDLIRILDAQLQGCFNLYMLNNTENGLNGFIRVRNNERKLLVNLHELVKLFQNKHNELTCAIRNRRQFLMSIIPFMRGYAHISLDDEDDFKTLSNIMHGYSDGIVDVIPIYRRLFGYDFGGEEVISVEDVLSIDRCRLDILDKNQFPLLAKTLEQSLIYYYIRMKVEKELVDSFDIGINKNFTLNQIIVEAFKCGTENELDYKKKREFRVFFTSRKTLLNEFNHFEGNMNIFQPAIDINPVALEKEIADIEAKLEEVKGFVRASHERESRNL